MLNAQDNELMCKVGPGTPMGEVLRRFWAPILISEDLPEPDCNPKEVRLLGEDFVAFRDSNGEIGFVEALCPHRRAPLFYGRNEHEGLRCIYHGWKFDVEGNCVDMPSEPAQYEFAKKVRPIGFPTREWGGIIWAYIGPSDRIPELPQLEWCRVPAEHRNLAKVQPGVQLCAGHRGRHRLQPHWLPAHQVGPEAGPLQQGDALARQRHGPSLDHPAHGLRRHARRPTQRRG